MMQQFEYKMLEIHWIHISDEKLNEFGLEGWELVGFTAASTSPLLFVYIFKRPLQQEIAKASQ